MTYDDIARAHGWIKLKRGWYHPYAEQYPGWLGEFVCYKTAKQLCEAENLSEDIMTAIGGKTKKKAAPNKPQVVIQRCFGVNEFALIEKDDKNEMVLSWVGDPNAASKYDSKYDAKNKTRHIGDIPGYRVFKVLEKQ